MSFIKQLVINKLDYYRYLIFRSKWRKLNPHNLTNAGCIFPLGIVQVGIRTYGTLNVVTYDRKDVSLKIGDYCSIAGSVHFLLSGEHDYKRLSMYPFRKICLNGGSESISNGPILVEDNVWIGYGCIILSGVTIGKGSVIGAGSIVVKDIPPYSIFAGGRIIKQRFGEEQINIANRIDFKCIDDDFIARNIDLLESNKIEDFYKILNNVNDRVQGIE